jgi:transcriptional regulator with GAF, ATPase, and Fis domain
MATQQDIEATWNPTKGADAGADLQAGPHGLIEVLAHVERDLILKALQDSHGNKAKAARALGITERLMGIRVKRLGIDWRGLRARRRHSELTL